MLRGKMESSKMLKAREARKKEKVEDKWETTRARKNMSNNYGIYINPTIPIITLKVNVLNIIERQILP